MNTASAMCFMICSAACVFFSFISPWWYTTLKPSLDGEYTYCFIDGTCRKGSYVSKESEVQYVYDWTLSLMLCSLVPLLCFIHFILMKRNRRYFLSVTPFYLSISGILTVLFLLSAVSVFGSEIDRGYGLPSLYGHQELEYPIRQKKSWGIHVGWYFAMIAIFLMLPAITLGIMMKDHRKCVTGTKETDPLLAPTIKQEEITRTASTPRPIQEPRRSKEEEIKEHM